MIYTYFDNAATSYPKPECVKRALLRSLVHSGGNPGRGAHALSLAASNEIYSCRERIAEHFGSSSADCVAFFSSDTAALNAIIKGAVRAGDNILISDAEHNSVRRAALSLSKRGVEVRTYRAFDGEDTALSDISMLCDCKTRLICAVHQSNICPLTLPVERIGSFCRRRGILFLVDSAQSAGHTHIDIKRIGADAICAPGHKGLFGLQGTGFAVLSERMKRTLIANPTIIEGGSGINSREDDMPAVLPERLEAGTLNTPGIAALRAGIDYVERIGIDEIAYRENTLYSRIRCDLLNCRRVKLYKSEAESGNILLFNISEIDCEETASLLDSYSICVRSGLHCAPTAHDAIGSTGAVRLSLGAFNTQKDVDRFEYALTRILK